jgi:aspartate kinase
LRIKRRPGVFTTTPTSAPRPKIDRISYDEMLEMASMGAQVLQNRSVEFAKKYNVRCMCLTFSDEPHHGHPGGYSH